MAHGQAQAEAAVRQLIARLDDGRFTYAMDNGAQVAVAVKVDRDARHVTIDFTGSSATLPDNFNAPLPVVRAAVLYVLRTMLDDPIPMNEGCLAPVTLIVRSEEHTSELQSLMRISYAVFCLKKNKIIQNNTVVH